MDIFSAPCVDTFGGPSVDIFGVCSLSGHLWSILFVYDIDKCGYFCGRGIHCSCVMVTSGILLFCNCILRKE